MTLTEVSELLQPQQVLAVAPNRRSADLLAMNLFNKGIRDVSFYANQKQDTEFEYAIIQKTGRKLSAKALRELQVWSDGFLKAICCVTPGPATYHSQV